MTDTWISVTYSRGFFKVWDVENDKEPTGGCVLSWEFTNEQATLITKNGDLSHEYGDIRWVPTGLST